MRLHQKPIPRSLALFCCLLHCSPRIRLSSVFCCWLLTLDCTVCTWFEFGLIFLLSLFFSLPHSAVRWSAAPSFFCPSAINVLTVDNVPIPIRNLIYFSLLCTAGNIQLSWKSQKGKWSRFSLHHLHWFTRQSCENQASCRDTLIQLAERDGSAVFSKCRIV